MKNRAKNKDLFVAEISFSADEEELRKLFSVCGTVRSVKLLTDPSSGKFTGRAFLRMDTYAEAKNAANTLDGALLIDRCIRVSLARDKPAEKPASAPDKPSSRRHKPGRNRQN